MLGSNIKQSNRIHISVIGTGYVGLVSGACFAELGHEVICIDNNQEKIAQLQRGKIPIYEPTLEEMVLKNLQESRLFFDTDLKKAVQNSQVIFIAVGTPTSLQDGRADLTNLKMAAREIAPFIEEYKVIVVKSTVPVGTCHRIKTIIREANPLARFDIVSNPEFLREGSAVYDFMYPDRIVMGIEVEKVKNIMNKIYETFILREVSIFYADLESSELIKYATNCFLATKIAFINEMANLCEKTGANIENVRIGLGLDKRIGLGHLTPGPGFGGSCFPKDTLALAHTAREVQAPFTIVEAVIKSNEYRKKQMVNTIIQACQGSVNGKRVAILGVAFKANTNDIRGSSAVVIIQNLQAKGAKVVAYDPVAMEAAQEILSNVTWALNVEEAIRAADAVVIVTEWQEFSDLDFHSIMVNKPIVIDFRNLYDPKVMFEKGIHYISIGRKTPNGTLLEEVWTQSLVEMEVIE